MPVPVTEGGEAHGGGHKRHSPGEGGLTTEQEGEYTAHTHGEKLTRNVDKHIQQQSDQMLLCKVETMTR